MLAPVNGSARIASLHPTWTPFMPNFSASIARIHRFVAVESILLVMICLLDLSSTLFWVAYRDAAEANPLMAYYLQNHGVAGFVFAKMIFLAMPLVIAEWARRHSPRFVQRALRFTIGAYLCFYLIGVSQINGGALAAANAVGIHASTTAPDDTAMADDTGYIDPTESR